MRFIVRLGVVLSSAFLFFSMPASADGRPAAPEAWEVDGLRILHRDAGLAPAAQGAFETLDAVWSAPPSRLADKELAPLGVTLAPDHALALELEKATAGGRRVLVYRQTVRGRPVVDGHVKLVAVGGRTVMLEWQLGEGAAEPHRSTDAVALVTRRIVRRGDEGKVDTVPTAVYVRDAGRLLPAWRAHATWTEADGTERSADLVVADADGRLLRRAPTRFGAINRRIYDAQNTTNPRNSLARNEGDPANADAAVNYVYDHLKKAYDYYLLKFSQDSLNGAGIQLEGSVHHKSNYTNAHFVGPNLLTFGDGNGTTWGSLAKDRSIIYHEYGHGIVYHTVALDDNLRDSAALIESLPDVIAGAVMLYHEGTSTPWWKMSQTAYTPGIAGDALRYLNDPAANTPPGVDWYADLDPCTPNEDDPECSTYENGSVVALAFAKMVQGGGHPRRSSWLRVDALGGIKPGVIFHHALDLIGPTETLPQLRAHTASAAAAEYGTASKEVGEVCKAWDTVGVPGQHTGLCSIVPRASTSVNAVSQQCYGFNTVSWAGVSGATSYKLFTSSSASNFNFATPIQTVPGGATSTDITVASTQYVRVQACNGQTCGALSSDYGIATYMNGCN